MKWGNSEVVSLEAEANIWGISHDTQRVGVQATYANP